ncbi:MAG: carbohydrate ABC transporter permease [Ruminococcaceae bacterium]|nr:carbohydrate ABC transporter permease [Oscillospiraceae bacterium]
MNIKFLSKLNVKGKAASGIYTVIIYVLLINLAFIFLYPFIFMLVTSFKSYNDLMDVTVKWYPKEFTPSNWVTAIKALNFKTTFFNSLFVTTVSTLGHIVSCSFIAYGFARYKFPLKKVLFAAVLLTIIVPIQTVIVPQYILYSNLGWIGSYNALIIPTFLGSGLKGGLFIFLFRQFFIQLSPSLEEAAAIDGSNPYMTYLRIILPSSAPVLLVCFVLSFVWHWNDFFEPSLYITDAKQFLLPQALPQMYELLQALEISISENELKMKEIFNEAVVMAGTGIAVAPLMVMYLAVQNKFVESIDKTGLVE